ncbi:MAG: hypothetical protein M3R38_26725 [Actinomycetota bacterium]|nr:hypothetical protein [Actinomycetota bacterium]
MEDAKSIRWVLVPVPEEMVPEIMEAVLGRVRSSRIPEAAAPPPQEEAYFGGWTEDELRDALKHPTRAMRIILPYLATHHPEEEWVGAPELAKEVYGEDGNSSQLGGALSSFTRRVKSTYGKETWPFDARPNEDTKIWEYRMDPKTAAAIRRILGL